MGNNTINFKGSFPYSSTRGLNKITRELKESNISYKVLEDRVVTGKDLVKYVKETKNTIKETMHNSIESIEAGVKKMISEFRRSRK